MAVAILINQDLDKSDPCESYRLSYPDIMSMIAVTAEEQAVVQRNAMMMALLIDHRNQVPMLKRDMEDLLAALYVIWKEVDKSMPWKYQSVHVAALKRANIPLGTNITLSKKSIGAIRVPRGDFDTVQNHD